MLHVDPAVTLDLQQFEQWLDSLPFDDSPPPSPVCGMCQHHRSRTAFLSLLTGVTVPALEYCSLRAGAGIESLISSSNPYAETCPFYVEDVPF